MIIETIVCFNNSGRLYVVKPIEKKGVEVDLVVTNSIWVANLALCNTKKTTVIFFTKEPNDVAERVLRKYRGRVRRVEVNDVGDTKSVVQNLTRILAE